MRALHLHPARASPARLVRRVERLHHARPRARGRARRRGTRSASAGSAVSIRRDAASPRGRARRAATTRSEYGRSRRSSPSRWRQSKKNGVRAARRLPRPRAADEPNRLIVTWNGCGRPSGRERDHLAVEHGRVDREPPASPPTTSGTRSVTSARLRVKARTSSPEPVHLEPRAVELPLDRRRPGARERLADVCRRLGEHRLTGGAPRA